MPREQLSESVLAMDALWDRGSMVSEALEGITSWSEA